MRNTALRTILLLSAFIVSRATEIKDGPKTAAFSCRGRSPGYYADLDSGCQDYHMCDAGGRRYTYSCPNQTRFQQRVMICDHWFMVNCSLSETHFGANLLIGQKDRQFVEHFQQASGHNDERSYPSRSRAFYAGPSSSSSSSSEDERTQPQGANEIKQALFAKHSSSAQSATKKSPEEKDSKTSNTNRFYSQFSTPTGSIKPTTDRSLSREFTNNPFFRSLSQTPASPADKGGRGSLTFLSPHPSDGVSTSGTPRTTAAPLPPRRTASSFSTPPVREATPNLRNTPSFPNHQQRRTSTLVTTAVPLTYDYNFVTPEGHSNHLTRTETPRLGNNFSKVIPNYGGFTSEPSLTTRYESLKTRERTDVRASPTPVTSAPHDLGVTPSPRADNGHTLNATQGGSLQPASYGSGQYRPNVTQDAGGLQRTPGGFRFTTVNAAPVPGGRVVQFSPLVPIVPVKTLPGIGGVPSGPSVTHSSSGGVPTGSGGVPIGSAAVPTGSAAVPTGSGGVPARPGTTFFGSGTVPSGSSGVPTGSGAVPTGSGATFSGNAGFPSGPGVTLSGNNAVSTGHDGFFTGGGAVAKVLGGVPTRPGTTFFGTGAVPSGSSGVPSGSGATLSGNNAISTGHDGFFTGGGAVAKVLGGVPTRPGTTFFGTGAVPSGSSGVPTGSGATLSGNGGVSTGHDGFFTGGGAVAKDLGAPRVSDQDALLTSLDVAMPPPSPGEDEDDYNTVEVRIADPRRMFFIADSAAREAEMLSSNNETVFKISLPSARPHGAMRFKGVRGAEGRRADCPQCLPAFLLPGKCQPCVLIRR